MTKAKNCIIMDTKRVNKLVSCSKTAMHRQDYHTRLSTIASQLQLKITRTKKNRHQYIPTKIASGNQIPLSME